MSQNERTVQASPFARKMTRALPRLAQGREDVLLAGEPGSGRRTLALAIHRERGKRRPLVMLDGSTATDAEFRVVLASGDENAAHASTGRRLSPLADQATLVFTDLDVVAPHNHALVASFLKEGRKRYAGLRVLATIAQPLVRLAQSGAFAPELAGQLEKFESIQVPALRERLEDVEELVASISRELCAAMGKPLKRADAGFISILRQGQWPGNIRQLAGVVGKSVLISHGDTLILPAEFLDESQHLADAINNIREGRVFVLDQTLDLVEKLLIQRALREYQYNQSRTAQILGLSEANFRYRLKKFGLPSIRQKA
ncbi:MAG: helix-turn-helix domain-containing protein [Bacteroidota bacterium]